MSPTTLYRKALFAALMIGLIGLSGCNREDQATTRNAAEDAAATAQGLAEQARQKAAEVAEAARETAGKAAEAARETAGRAAEAARETAGRAAEATRETAGKAAEAARETATQAAGEARQMADEAGAAAKELAAKAGTVAADAAQKAGDTARELGNQAAEAGRDLAARATTGATGETPEGAGPANPQTGPMTAPSAPADQSDSSSGSATGASLAAAAGATAAAAGAAGAATAAADKAATAGEPLKAAWVYVGPVGDGGWTFAHDNGRKAAQAAMGQGMVSTFVESVPESADAERVLRDLAVQGNDIIFGTTFGYMETMRKLSQEFPDVKWEHATGYKTTRNMRTYDSRTYEGAYLAGLIAGAMTSSNTLGVVGSIPIPEVIRNINAFTLGAQSMNPAIKTRVVWVNKWFDPPREAEAAQSLLDQGADVLFQNTDSSAVLQTAEKAGKQAFGWDSDMTAYGPKAHLASAIINWGPYYTESVRAAAAGTWTTGSDWWGLAEGAIDLVSISSRVPTEVRQTVEKAKAGIADGSMAIWTGPIVDNAGNEVLAQGKVADDAFLGGINFFVRGVEGRVPAAR